MKYFYPQQIFVERRALEYPMAQEILIRFPNVPRTEIKSYQSAAAALPELNARIHMLWHSIISPICRRR